jgi:hypothetical protein
MYGVLQLLAPQAQREDFNMWDAGPWYLSPGEETTVAYSWDHGAYMGPQPAFAVPGDPHFIDAIGVERFQTIDHTVTYNRRHSTSGYEVRVKNTGTVGAYFTLVGGNLV